MHSMVATRPITIEEFAMLPLEGRWELIDGEPVELTPSADESSSIGATIITLLGSFVRPRGLGRLYGADGGFVLFPDRPTVRVRTPRLSGQRELLRVKHAEASPVSHPIWWWRSPLRQTVRAKWSPSWRCIRRRVYRSSGWSIRSRRQSPSLRPANRPKSCGQEIPSTVAMSSQGSAWLSEKSSPDLRRGSHSAPAGCRDRY